jgi:hypothetical protein
MGAGLITLSTMMILPMKIALLAVACALLTQCGTSSSTGSGNLLGGPTVEERNAAIASESSGDYYYGRRYYIEKTRFWGYLRKPGQSWNNAKLVMMREDRKRVPDRLSENGPDGQRYGYDQNYEYKVRGNYTGRQIYDPNSNQFLDEFMPTNFELTNRQPGWIFKPTDRYDSKRITMMPR